jgi:4'-phosphopantetheinyl transferase
VWLLDLTTPSELDERGACLSEEERRRAAGIVDRGRRQRYVRRTHLVRVVLGGLLGLSPRSVPIEQNGAGKPRLACQSDIAFNASDTGDTAVVAATRVGPVGVDVESSDRERDVARLASRCFDVREASAIGALEPIPAREAFLRAWTAKEAVVKALGIGLAEHIAAVVVDPDPAVPLRLLAAPGPTAAADWSVTELCLAPRRLRVAVAVPIANVPIVGVHGLDALGRVHDGE